MGVQVHRIEKEFIFTRLVGERAVLGVHGYKKESQFRIGSFDDERLNLAQAEAGANVFAPGEEIRLFFSFHNNYYTLTSRVLERTEDGLAVANPISIYRDPQRKYERLRLHGIRLSFFLAGDMVELDFPKTDTFTMVERPEYASDFKPERMSELIASFRSSLHGKTSDLKIVMYRDKAPSSFEEKLTVKLGKTLWIPSTEEDLPLNDPGFAGNVIVKKEVEDFIAETGTAPYLVRSEVSNLLFVKAKNNITAELYCPVLYHEYAVGYIHALNRRPREERFDEEFLAHVLQFSRVLAYSLEVNGYYRQYAKDRETHEAPVIDLSASGLLFTTAAELDKKIDLFQDLDLRLEIGGRALTIGTRVMRKFKDSAHVYFAAQFLSPTEDDFAYLYEFLYGKPFAGEAGETWEGGVPPPPLAAPRRPEE